VQDPGKADPGGKTTVLKEFDELRLRRTIADDEKECSRRPREKSTNTIPKEMKIFLSGKSPDVANDETLTGNIPTNSSPLPITAGQLGGHTGWNNLNR
jgi:hypothetical protein